MDLVDRRSAYKGIIIGAGEVGQALKNIFLCPCVDISGHEQIHYDYMHIVFPWSEQFETEVLKYQGLYTPRYTIIHSTVPVGTSSRLCAVHSPIRGMSPFLEIGIRTFHKFLGGPKAFEVAEYFRDHGLKVLLCDKSETTELGMLLGTEHYRMCIEFAKYAKDLCEKHKVSYGESYTLFSYTYNAGWQALGLGEYVRPVLQPIAGPVGGHCLVSNSELIKK
jgi:hypothetical protein